MSLETQESETVDLEKISCGNIAGLWLPKSQSTEDDQRLLDEINLRWLGISLDDLKQVAYRATVESEIPGVVLRCANPGKREIVKAALPLVNHLVITT